MDLDCENPSIVYKLIDELGNNRLFSFIYTNYIKTLNLKGNERVLDFGSGSGAGSKHLAKVLQKGNGHLTCIDISAYWMKKAKKRMKKYTNVDFLLGQLPDLNLKSNSFDAIYVFYTLHHVPQNLRNDIVKEFFKILKEDGRLYIKEPQRKNDGMPISEICDLMQKNGFHQEHSKTEKASFSAIYSKPDNN